jgi:hypothetical protein
MSNLDLLVVLNLKVSGIGSSTLWTNNDIHPHFIPMGMSMDYPILAVGIGVTLLSSSCSTGIIPFVCPHQFWAVYRRRTNCGVALVGRP